MHASSIKVGVPASDLSPSGDCRALPTCLTQCCRRANECGLLAAERVAPPAAPLCHYDLVRATRKGFRVEGRNCRCESLMDAHRPHTDASEAVQAECPVRCSDDSLGAYGQRLGVLSGSDSRRHTVPPADSAGFAFAGSARCVSSEILCPPSASPAAGRHPLDLSCHNSCEMVWSSACVVLWLRVRQLVKYL